MGKCGYTALLDCMRSKLFQSTNKTEQELADAFGGIVERIDTPSIFEELVSAGGATTDLFSPS